MKKVSFKTFCLVATTASILSAQNTNPWPASGNVGIGTANPSTKLDILTSTFNDGVKVTQTSNLYHSSLFLNHTGGGHNWSLQSTNNGDFALMDVTAGGSAGIFIAGGNGLPFFPIPAGNIGIGTPFAGSKLTIAPTTNNDDGILVTQGGSGGAALFLHKANTGKNWSLLSSPNGDFSINDVTTTTNRVYIVGSTGNFGLGTQSPAQKLDVAGNIKLSGAFMPNNLAGTSGQLLQSAGSGQAPTWISGGLLTGGTANYLPKWNNSNSLSSVSQVFDDGTNVGIGTAVPGTKLEVVDGSAAPNPPLYLPLLRLRNNNWQCNQEAALEFWNGSSKNFATSKIVSKMDGCGGNGEALVFETQNAGLSYTTPKLTIKNDGKIIVGTQPQAANLAYFNVNIDGQVYSKVLEVFDQFTGFVNFSVRSNGNVYCRELNVRLPNTLFPDYVFNKEYRLMSFEELDKYIKQNKHLPNIPSATEVEKSGVNLGDLTVKQLEKIEELTLYILELEKRIKTLENK